MNAHESHEVDQYLAEDPSGLSFGDLFKVIRAQSMWPIGLVGATVIKIIRSIKGQLGAATGINRTVDFIDAEEVPVMAMTAFEGFEHQLHDFDTIFFKRFRTLGLRQQNAAYALHRDGRTLACMSWQQHVTLRPRDQTMNSEEDRIVSTISSSLDLVSYPFEGLPIATLYLSAADAVTGRVLNLDIADIEYHVKEEQLTEVVARHLQKIAGKSVEILDARSAVDKARQFGERLLESMLKRGLMRPLTEKEYASINKFAAKHGALFEPFTRTAERMNHPYAQGIGNS